MKICWKPELIFPFGLVYLYQPSLLCPYIFLGICLTCSSFISSPMWFTFFMFTCTDNQQPLMGLTERFLKQPRKSLSRNWVQQGNAGWATITCLNQSTPVMIQEPAGAMLKQFYHFLWFAHMSLMLRNFKELKRYCVTWGSWGSLSAKTAQKPGRNQHRVWNAAPSCQCQHSRGKASLMCPS